MKIWFMDALKLYVVLQNHNGFQGQHQWTCKYFIISFTCRQQEAPQPICIVFILVKKAGTFPGHFSSSKYAFGIK